MTDYQLVQECIEKSSWPALLRIMFALAYWMMQKITNDNCVAFCAYLGYTFDTTAKTISNGTTTYTIFSALEAACDSIYPDHIMLGKYIMKNTINAAESENYITPSEKSALVAKL